MQLQKEIAEEEAPTLATRNRRHEQAVLFAAVLFVAYQMAQVDKEGPGAERTGLRLLPMGEERIH